MIHRYTKLPQFALVKGLTKSKSTECKHAENLGRKVHKIRRNTKLLGSVRLKATVNYLYCDCFHSLKFES